MLADQLIEAATAGRTRVALDETARLTWRAHAEGILTDGDAKDISEAVEARRAVISGSQAQTPQPALEAVPAAPAGPRRRLRSRPREKMFGMGRPRALDRNAKARIMHTPYPSPF